jgi:hypothetical protein
MPARVLKRVPRRSVEARDHEHVAGLEPTERLCQISCGDATGQGVVIGITAMTVGGGPAWIAPL